MLPANLPPTYIQQSNVAEIRQYILPLERSENDEPVKPPYYLFEVQLTPIIGTASFTGRSTIALFTNLVNNAPT
jgi:hypothetical protein